MTEPIDNPWLRPIADAHPDAPLVVVLPHAGGSASYYWPLGRLLSNDVGVWAVQYPGRQDRHRESQLSSIADLAAAITDELHGYAAHRRIVLFGHSMGAVLAFEITRMLRRRRVDVGHLVVSGRGAPSWAPPPINLDGDTALIARLLRLSGTNPVALEDPDLRSMVLKTLRADYGLIQAYRCEVEAVVDVPLTVLSGTRDPLVPQDTIAKWAEHTNAPVQFRAFVGGHFFFMDHDTEVADVLRRAVGQ